MGIRNSRIASLARSRPRSGLALLLFSILALIIWNPRFYHTLSGRDIIPLIPKPVVSTRLEGRFLDLDTRLKEHFSKHKQVLPEKVFPYHALTKAQQKRYSGLRDAEGTYMFSTITRQIQDQLPDLLSALLVVVDTLGSAKVSFSFLEGPSSDVTPSVFRDVLHPFLISLNVPESRIKIVTDSPKIDFNAGNRIELLANLRNKAIEPLWDDRGVGGVGHDVKALIMFNDVYLRAEHILEVMYKHHVKGAGISTAWDWWKRDPAYYYDVWVGRTVSSALLTFGSPPLITPHYLQMIARLTPATSSTPCPTPTGPPPPTSSPPPPPPSTASTPSTPSPSTLRGTAWPSSIRNRSWIRE